MEFPFVLKHVICFSTKTNPEQGKRQQDGRDLISDLLESGEKNAYSIRCCSVIGRHRVHVYIQLSMGNYTSVNLSPKGMRTRMSSLFKCATHF